MAINPTPITIEDKVNHYFELSDRLTANVEKLLELRHIANNLPYEGFGKSLEDYKNLLEKMERLYHLSLSILRDIDRLYDELVTQPANIGIQYKEAENIPLSRFLLTAIRGTLTMINSTIESLRKKLE